MYADNLVLFAEPEGDLQKQVYFLEKSLKERYGNINKQD